MDRSAPRRQEAFAVSHPAGVPGAVRLPQGRHQSRLLTHTPCVGIKLPRAVAREMQFLSADDVALLAKVIAEPYETLVYLLAYGGPPLGRNCRPQAEANRS